MEARASGWMDQGDEDDGLPVQEEAPLMSVKNPEKLARRQSTLAAGGYIKVSVRVRPFSRLELATREPQCLRVDDESTLVLTREAQATHRQQAEQEDKVFYFDRVFWSVRVDDANYASQDTLMTEIGYELRDNAFEGYNSCLFSYGQTGSGKTYSVLGGPDEQRGLLPRICEELFAKIDELRGDPNGESEFTTTVSYLEIYNEQIRDLLVPEDERPTNLQVRQNPTVGTFVPGVQDTPVFTWADVQALLEFGVKTRAVASTVMNEASSRSHCIFILDMLRKTRQNGRTVHLRSKLNLVDLAGSERQKKTQATGDILRQGAMINKSLTNLARVVSKLAETSESRRKNKEAEHVPFRNSKLTFLLQDSLTGNSKTAMIAAVSPAASSHDETFSTLLFARRVKDVKTKAKKNEVSGKNWIQELMAECEHLREQVSSNIAQGELDPVQKGDLKYMEDLVSKYGRDLEVQLQVAQDLRTKRKSILQEAGLTSKEMSHAMGLDLNTPQLLNVCYEPELNGCLVYFLQPNFQLSVGKSKQCRIHLKGLGMEDKMVTLINREKHNAIDMEYHSGRVLVNGQPLRGKTSLRHNDRIIFGFTFCFRLMIPALQPRGSVITAPDEPLDVADVLPTNKARDPAAARDLVEVNEAQRRCASFAEQLRSKIGDTRTQAFELNFRRVSVLAEEANAIMKELRPRERLQFSVEIISDMCDTGHQVPECVVRLKRLDTGSARFRNLVRKHVLQGNLLTRTMREIRASANTDLEHAETLMILDGEQFRERLQQFREVYRSFVYDGSQNWESCDPDTDPWQAMSPLGVSELKGELAEEREQNARLRERLALQPRRAAADQLEPPVGDVGVAKCERGRDGESATETSPGDSDTGREARRSCPDDPPGAPRAGGFREQRHEAHKTLLGQVQAAFDHGLSCGAAEGRTLRRHMARLEACERTHYEECKALQMEIREESCLPTDHSERRDHDAAEGGRLLAEVWLLRAELRAARQEAEAEADPRAGSQAMELAEFYIQHRGETEESEKRCLGELAAQLRGR